MASPAFQALAARRRGQFAKNVGQQGYGATASGKGPAPPMAVNAPQAAVVPSGSSSPGPSPDTSIPGVPQAVLARYAKYGNAAQAFRRRQLRQQIDKGVNLKNPVGDAEVAFLRRHGAL